MKEKSSWKKRRTILKEGASLLGVSLCSSLIPSFMSGCESDTTKSSDTVVDFDVSSTDKTIAFDLSLADSTVSYDISSDEALSVIGGAVKTTFGENNAGKPVIIVREDAQTFTVLSTVCTHLGCEVNLPAGAGGTIVCPCHDSAFSPSDGSVVTGPAAEPLTTYPSVFDPATGTLTITFNAGLPSTGGATRWTFEELNAGNPVLVIRHDTTSFSVLSSTCTNDNQTCAVDLPAAPGTNIVCPCNGSVFSPVDGSVISGPAEAPLTPYPTVFDPASNMLTITYTSDLSSAGGAVKRTFGKNNGGRPVVIIRHGEGDFMVLTSVCTHQGCEVNLPEKPGGDFVCPCHNSIFSSKTGAVKDGPASAPLRMFPSRYDGKTGILSITF